MQILEGVPQHEQMRVRVRVCGRASTPQEGNVSTRPIQGE